MAQAGAKENWYYSVQGKAQGPVNAQFLVENLQAGKLTLVDLVFREGDAAWCTVGEIPEFRDAYKALPLTPPPVSLKAKDPEPESHSFKKLIELADSKSVEPLQMPEAGWPSDWRLTTSWIILKKRPDGGGFDQDGPFSAEHIVAMIGEGKIDYSQYCWKPGYTRWFRIGNLPEFDRRKRDRDNDTVNQIIPVPEIHDSLPALSREELLASVQRMKHKPEVPHEALPEGAVGEDLTVHAAPTVATAPPPEVPQKVQQISHESLSPQQVSSAAFAVPIEVVPPSAKKSAPVPPRRAARLIVAGLVAGLAVVGLMEFAEQSQVKSAKVSDTSSKKKAKKSFVAQVPARAKRADPAPQAAAPKTPVPASVIEIVPNKLETDSAALVFQTDANPGDIIIVRLAANTGEILRWGSFSRIFNVVKTNDEVPTLDLSKLDLPHGTYRVSASVGNAASSTQVFLGTRSKEFLAQLERHIKSLSYRQQTERKAMYYGARRLEDLAKALVKKSQNLKGQPKIWQNELQVWRAQARDAALPVLQLAQAPENEAAYPEQLAAFKAATERLGQFANEIDAAMNQNRGIASNELETIVSQWRQVREEAARLTGRPAQAPANP